MKHAETVRTLRLASIVFRGTLGMIATGAVIASVGGIGWHGVPPAAATNGPLLSSSFLQNEPNTEPILPSAPDDPETSTETGEPGENSPPDVPPELSVEEGIDPGIPLFAETAPLASVLPGQVSPLSPWGEHTVSRLGGADRYEAAVSVTKHAYPQTADTVIVASGEVFSDALSAAPLSAKLKAPLLLTEGARLPNTVAAEIARLKPNKILIVGGIGTVQPEVQAALERAAPTVMRIWGSDRYSTSLELSKYGWPTGATSVFISTGSLFADALSSAAAAAKLGGPVILVPGQEVVLPRAVSDELTRLGAGNAFVVGGPATVSPSIEAALATPNRKVTRFGGVDRFEVSANVTSAVFTGGADVYWASGYAFADALAGAAAAGARGAALMLVETDCVPTSVYAASDQLLPGATTVLGGLGTIGNGVRNGNECMNRPGGISNADWSSMQSLYGLVNESRFAQGVGGLRLANGSGMAASLDRAAQIASGRIQPSDAAVAQPWMRYQVSAASGVNNNRPQRVFDLMRGNSGTARWLYQPNGGVRGFVGVGYSTSGGRSGAALFFGAGL